LQLQIGTTTLVVDDSTLSSDDKVTTRLSSLSSFSIRCSKTGPLFDIDLVVALSSEHERDGDDRQCRTLGGPTCRRLPCHRHARSTYHHHEEETMTDRLEDSERIIRLILMMQRPPS
jgi:hypothetical protein